MSSIMFKDARANAIDLIKNIRTVRTKILSNQLTTELFREVNGDECALEGLLGRDVTPEVMNEEELAAVRRDVIRNLNTNEAEAFVKLREMFKDYFVEFDRVTDLYEDRTKLHAKERPFIKADRAIVSTESKGCFANGEDLTYALESMNAVSGFIETIAPVMMRVFDTDDYAEPEPGIGIVVETPSAPTEIPANGDPDPTPTPAKGEPEPKIDIDNPDHTVSNPDIENEGAMADVVNVVNDNRSLGISMSKWVDQGKLEDNGYTTAAEGFAALDKIDAVIQRFKAARKLFRESVPVDTCVSDKLINGSATFFAAFESVKTLLDNAAGLAGKLLDQTAGLEACLKY